MNFTKRKFFAFELPLQHKKCLELLKSIYEDLLQQKESPDKVEKYLSFLHWMNIEPFYPKNLKEVSDQYHFHLKMAKMNLREHNLLPTLTTQDKEAKAPFLENCIYLDNIRSAYNVGSILRTNEALRIGSIYFSEKTPFVDNEKVTKTAMGSSKHVSCYNNVAIENLTRPLIGFDTSLEAISLYDFIFPEKFTLIFGNEEYGISDPVLNKLDYILQIPMLGIKNSINVACAFSIAASEIRRQIKII
ncbi:MAG: TrmH family RNA methyltransferase [Chlamydiae bacterium]|nr:TrmH family RNA methyltransferase [Chlamydiota bacterium]